MEEEDRIVRQRELGDWFHGDVTYGESGEFGSWSFASSTTESLQARFELLATEAGIALSSPPGTLPHVYWLHRLFVDLRANKSPHIRIYTDDGGIIDRLFEASATYCARLNRQSLENAVMSYEGSSFERGPANQRAEVNLSKAENVGMPAQELSVATTDLGTDRTKMVDDFLVQCNRESAVGFKVIRKHIWLAVGHARARQFQYWQEGSDKATDADDRAFRRILRMSPADFIAHLVKKGIFPSHS